MSLTRNLPGGNYAISAGTLNINALSQSIGAFPISGGTLTGRGTLTGNASYDVRGGRMDANLAGDTVGLNKSAATGGAHRRQLTPAAPPSAAERSNSAPARKTAC